MGNTDKNETVLISTCYTISVGAKRDLCGKDGGPHVYMGILWQGSGPVGNWVVVMLLQILRGAVEQKPAFIAGFRLCWAVRSLVKVFLRGPPRSSFITGSKVWQVSLRKTVFKGRGKGTIEFSLLYEYCC